MQDLLIATVVRFAFLAVPLFIMMLSARRALLSRNGNTMLYLGFAGYSAVAAAWVLPWALQIAGLNSVALVMAASTALIWTLYNRLYRQAVPGYRPGGEDWRDA